MAKSRKGLTGGAYKRRPDVPRSRTASRLQSPAMRILVSTLTPFPSGTAHVVHITATAQGFADAGHAVTLATAQRGPGWPDDTAPSALGFTVATLALRDHRGQSLLNGMRLRRLVREVRPDLCFADDVRSGLALAGAGAPTLVELHSLRFHASALSRLALRRLIASPNLRRIITISQALRDDLIAVTGVAAGMVTVAPEAARPRSDVELAAPAPDWLASAMRPGRLQVGYSGSLYGGRGVNLMVGLAARLPAVDVHVLGGPPAQAAALRERTDRPANLHVHGLRPVADAERLQNAMDVLLAPYSSSVQTPGGVDTARWMSPMKVFEYLAAGRAMVCSDLPVLRETLTHEETALLVEPDDTDAWVDAVVRLRDDEALRRGIGTRGRALHAEHHTWGHRTHALLGAAGMMASDGRGDPR